MAQEKRASEEVTDTPYVASLRQEARRMARAEQLAFSFALRKIAAREGYNNWEALIRQQQSSQANGNGNRGPKIAATEPAHRGELRRAKPTQRTVIITYKKRRRFVTPTPERNDLGETEQDAFHNYLIKD